VFDWGSRIGESLQYTSFFYFAYYFNMLECTSTSRLVTGKLVCWSSEGFNNATSGTDIVDAFLALDCFLSPEIKVCLNSGLI
jgi:hypothetical protein